MSFLKNIAIVFILIPFFGFSQTIKGKVKDKTEVIPWANIVLTDASNNLIAGTTTDDNGVFEVSAKKGNYTLTISFLGYVDFKKSINLTTNIDLGEIILLEDSNQLEEVVIKAKKPLFERQADRMVFNVENNIATKGTDAIETLKITPGLMITNNTIELLGKGTSRVMVNGRIVQLSGDELISYLNGISSDNIKKIEVITNPPAKYEASGNGGLINIILKKGTLNSWKNSTSLSLSQRYYLFGTLRNSFFYNKNKLQLSASVNAAKGDLKNFETISIEYPDNPWFIDANYIEKQDALSGRLSLDYDISNKFSIGLLYMGNAKSPGDGGITTSNIFNSNGELTSYLINKSDDEIDISNNSLNFHSTIKLDTLGRSISIDADIFKYNFDDNRRFSTEDFDANGNFLQMSSSAISKANQIIDNYSAKIDVNHPFKTFQLSYGAKYNVTKSSSGLLFFDRLSGTPQLDENRSNEFEYEESNSAFYVSTSKQFNEKFNVKAGLRLEHTKTDGFSTSMNERNKRDYTKLFPTLYVTYKSDEKNQFGFNYGKRIERPNFNMLNPFRSYLNANSYSEGNPLLQPSFSDNFELFHSYKNKWNTNFSLSVTTEGFGLVFSTDEVNNIQIITRENYFKQYKYSFSESYTYSNDWFQSQNNINLIGYKSIFEDGFNAKPRNGVQFVASTNNTFSLNENSKIQVNSWYSSAHNRGLFSLNEMFSLSVGYQQSFLNKNLNLSIMMNDIFNTSRVTDYASAVNGIEQHYGQDRGNRNLAVSLTYNFGNNKIKTKNRTFGNDEELNRTN